MYRIIITLFIIISLIRGEDYYEILGINRSAGQDEIRKAFRALAMIHHPDKNVNDPNAQKKFVQLTTAYEVLKEPDSRRRYDHYGKASFEKHTYSSSQSYHENIIHMYENDKYVITLERNEYYESVMNSGFSWFVNFYSPMCSHCHYLAPIWREVAKLCNGAIKIAVVNCEDDWHLCHQVGIGSYPTLLHFKKNSQHGIHYTGERTQEAIMRFALDRLNIRIPIISESRWKLLLHGMEIIKTPMLIFICGDQQDCFTSDEKLITATTFDKIIDVKVFMCEDICHDKVSYNTRAVYLPTYNANSWEPVFFDKVSDINALIQKLFEQLPNPQELTSNDFENIKQAKSDISWLICFYLGNATAINIEIKKLLNINVNLGKINCGRSSQLCNTLGINHYPIWGVLKPGGAFELHHGKNTQNDITKFARISIKATNVWALSETEALSILQRDNGNEVWFLDWYAPWCPPCIQFLSEFRRASLEFHKSIVRFGTIDCSAYITLCRQYNIHTYPTSVLINGSNTYEYTLRKTAVNIIQFINEKRNPSVIELTMENFYRLAEKKSKTIWVVNYFIPWYNSCQRLMPHWIAVARSLRDLSFVNVASVNCYDKPSLCASQKFNSYPNIRMYPLGNEGLHTIALYNGQYDMSSILTWITTFFPRKVRDLNPSDYRKMLNDKHLWIVDFYVPHCEHCQRMEPEFSIAAQLLENVQFGRINCNFYMHDCVQANVKIFPTLMLYTPKQKRKNSYDGIKITAITAKAIRDEVLKIINSRTKHDEL